MNELLKLIVITDDKNQDEINTFKKLSRYYGVSTKTIDINRSEIKTNGSNIGAIFLKDGHLKNRKSIEILNHTGQNKKLLFFHISKKNDDSQGMVINELNRKSIGELEFTKKRTGLMKELSGQKFSITFNSNKLRFVDLNEINKYELIMWINCDNRIYPIFVKEKEKDIFHYVDNNIELNVKEVCYRNVNSILPYILFLRHCFNEKIWHKEERFANLTIDDPWLIEPYGNLSFKKLLYEMQTTNFHTTIAFIPWNYNRNKKEIINIFKTQNKWFSLSIHGNNHEHYEFNRYDKVEIQKQNQCIYQAVARMDQLKKQEGLNYDRVMVFPHGICPKDTIEILKRLNFTGTVNCHNVPLEYINGIESENIYKLANNEFGKFPLIKRNPVNVDKEIILIDLFLEKPIILYTHQDFFKNGIDSFNEIAHFINEKSHYNIQWASLGKIIENLYLKRYNDDKIEIKAFSRISRFNDKLTQNKDIDIREVKVDTSGIEKIIVGKGVSSKINNFKNDKIYKGKKENYFEVIYRNDNEKINVNVEKRSLKLYFLRILSDFRDIVLSRIAIGRFIIKCLHTFNKIMMEKN